MDVQPVRRAAKRIRDARSDLRCQCIAIADPHSEAWLMCERVIQELNDLLADVAAIQAALPMADGEQAVLLEEMSR